MTHAPLARANGGNTFLRPASCSPFRASGITGGLARFARLVTLIAVALIVELTSLTALGAAPRWKVLETPRFTVVSQFSEAQTREWATDFSQFMDSMQFALNVNERLLPKLTVLMFSRDRDFRPYLPFKPNGEPWDVAGYFASRESWAVIGLPESWRDEHTRETIFHEGSHWFLSQYQGRLPLSVNEGFAEVCSSFEVRDKRARWGKPIDYNLAVLYENGTSHLEPLHELMLTGAGSRAFNSDHRTGRFYAQSWAFVHYLMFGMKADGHGSFGAFLQALDEEPTVEAAFVKTFGKPSAQVDEDLRRYIVGGKYAPRSRAIDPNEKIEGEFKDAPPEVIQVALARLALVSGHPELALKHARDAVAVAPTSAAAFDTLALVLNEKEPETGGAEEAEKAITLGSRDAVSYVIAAAGRSRNSFGGLSPREARRVVNLLEKAVNLCPSSKSAYVSLAHVVGQLDTVRDQDLPFLIQGARFYPDEQVLKIGLAQLKRKQGDRETARALLDAVLRDATKLNANTIGFVRTLQSEWASADVRDEVLPLVEARRFPEALAAIDRHLEQGQLAWEARQAVLLNREKVAAEGDMQAAKRAWRSGDKTEALRLLALVDAAPRAEVRLKQEAAALALRIQSGGAEPRGAVDDH